MPPITWQFVEDDPNGAAWLAAPSETFSFVETTDQLDGGRYRIMVVTRTWLQKQVTALGRDAKYSFFAPMLLVRDGTPDQLRQAIDDALSHPGISMIGRPVSGEWDAV